MKETAPSKHLSNGLVTIAFLLASHCCAYAQDHADLVSTIEPSVVRIEVISNEGGSLGSGFVVDDQGTIVTNCHVLAGAKKATAFFSDGRSTPVTGTYVVDESRDIVIAQIGTKNAPPLSIATAYPRKGSTVLAIGAPKGLDFSVSDGIVSAIRSAKDMAEDTGIDRLQGTWIQTTTPLSPGNSGGPLVNVRGEVVAMNTLASTGSSQNLNFGISARDISNAILFSKRSRLTDLASGVGQIEMEEKSSPDASPGSEIQARKIPDTAFEDFIVSAKDDFSSVMQTLRSEAARAKNDLNDMREGRTFLPIAVARSGMPFAKETISSRRNRWYFASQAAKDEAVFYQRNRVSELNEIKSKGSSASPDNPSYLASMLAVHGPPLNIRNNESIGHVSELVVLHAFDSHSVLVLYQAEPYLFWMESTAGISGGELLACPVFVAGTATAELQSGLTRSVTVLQEVTKKQIKKAVDRHFDDLRQAPPLIGGLADGYRIWNDATGKHSVNALLLMVVGDKVRLKRQADGETIEIPIAILSAADQKYIRE